MPTFVSMTVAMPVAVLVRMALGRHAQLQQDASVCAAVRREESRDTLEKVRRNYQVSIAARFYRQPK